MPGPHTPDVAALSPKRYPIIKTVKCRELLQIVVVISASENTKMPVTLLPLGVAQGFEKNVLTFVVNIQTSDRSKGGRFVRWPSNRIDAIEVDRVFHNSSIR